ncbi:MAG TPA: hypothetical protein VHP83_10390 [Aggregatilineaceae bacterium]|nr:hypothetical protein [Aggregatilineaceae bacterium]
MSKRVSVYSRSESAASEVNARGASKALGLTPDANRSLRVRLLPLVDIVPDPVQPRRGLPGQLRDEWIADPGCIANVLDKWEDRANQEATNRGRATLDPLPILRGEQEQRAETESEAGPYESTFTKLLMDAATVYKHGLEHPITVVYLDKRWQIQSGERRTLMHWALVLWLEEARFSEIPALETTERSIWKQAAENNARQDLTAIERARQLALLLMDSYPKQEFQPYTELLDYAFYRQALELRVPRGKAGDFLAAMGLKNEVQLRQYRQLLGLPEEVWQLADNQRWTESHLRLLLQSARDIPDGWNEVHYLTHLARVEAGLEAPLPIPPTPPQKRESVTIVTDSSGKQTTSRRITTPTVPPKSSPTSPRRPTNRTEYVDDSAVDPGYEEEYVDYGDEDSGPLDEPNIPEPEQPYAKPKTNPTYVQANLAHVAVLLHGLPTAADAWQGIAPTVLHKLALQVWDVENMLRSIADGLDQAERGDS